MHSHGGDSKDAKAQLMSDNHSYLVVNIPLDFTGIFFLGYCRNVVQQFSPDAFVSEL